MVREKGDDEWVVARTQRHTDLVQDTKKHVRRGTIAGDEPRDLSMQHFQESEGHSYGEGVGLRLVLRMRLRTRTTARVCGGRKRRMDVDIRYILEDRTNSST